MNERELANDATGADDLKYRHVLRAVAAQPWAVQPWVLAVIRDVVSYRAHGVRLSREEISELIAGGKEEAAVRRAGGQAGRGGVAVLPLYGIIAPRASVFAATSSSGTGVDEFTKMFREAMASDEVGSILIDIDSPGGQVGGVPELADEIRAARGQGKPIVAFANGMAASAAYWIASQCDELVVTPSGEVGSIGVYAAHEDISEQLAMDGVKVTLISAGEFKTEGNPFEPLTEEARAAFQQDVDAFYVMFKQAVAKGRGVPAAAVDDGFGQGRMLMAHAAVTEGMADSVATFDETLQRLARGKGTSRKAAAGRLIEVEIVGDTEDVEISDAAPAANADERAPIEDAPNSGDHVVVQPEDEESSPLELVEDWDRRISEPSVRQRAREA